MSGYWISPRCAKFAIEIGLNDLWLAILWGATVAVTPPRAILEVVDRPDRDRADPQRVVAAAATLGEVLPDHDENLSWWDRERRLTRVLYVSGRRSMGCALRMPWSARCISWFSRVGSLRPIGCFVRQKHRSIGSMQPNEAASHIREHPIDPTVSIAWIPGEPGRGMYRQWSVCTIEAPLWLLLRDW